MNAFAPVPITLAKRCRDVVLVAGAVLAMASPAGADTLTTSQIFRRPVISRAYEQNQWVLRDADKTGLRETAVEVGTALADLQPSYVSGLIYLQSDTIVSDAMISDYATIRSAVRAHNPDARFDVEISLNPKKHVFASPEALVAFMKRVEAQLHPDGWWFDFYSVADPDLVARAVKYAHGHGQTVGGNVFGSKVPPNSDAVAFVDDPVPGSQFGYDFSPKEIAALKASSPSTRLLGHLQSNPQNAPNTESCVYIQQWHAAKRLSYLQYWVSQQAKYGFTFMYPVFYPLCPGAYAYDPLKDYFPDGKTLYSRLLQLSIQH